MSTMSNSSPDAAEESKAPAVGEAAPAPSPTPAARKRTPRTRAVKEVEATAPVPAPAEVRTPSPARSRAARKTAPASKKEEAVNIKPVRTKTPKAPEVVATEPAAVKHKLIRDSFTFPENEYAQIEALKRKALSKAHHVKKSEVLRAGIAALSAMSDAALLAALKAVPALKTGRPKSGKAGGKKR